VSRACNFHLFYRTLVTCELLTSQFLILSSFDFILYIDSQMRCLGFLFMLSQYIFGDVYQIHASVVRGNDGSAGFSLLVFSEDYSLVLLDKPAAVSTGLLTAE